MNTRKINMEIYMTRKKKDVTSRGKGEIRKIKKLTRRTGGNISPVVDLSHLSISRSRVSCLKYGAISRPRTHVAPG